ncbi:MAG TPA: Crp/Fnr family transcriptional regulator [Candidatus Blautia faecavium]|uniref:Crp/Fnr family transcriptional regulator n=1 Tax=Candidatus Blautia faecavium TaxID=2838487 RepID=A0A9D2LTG0_9FIRM|nr:Crp/Fnr family transcriptional regulator [Candidatus Blautia faecavium]
MADADLLKGIEFFKNIDSHTLQELSSHGRVREYDKGMIVYRAKEQVKYIYFQLQGKSILYNMTHSGSRKIIFILGRGELLNDNVSGEQKTSLFCETIEKSAILEIPFSVFLKQMEKDFKLTSKVISSQERKIWRLGHQLKNTMGSIYLERKLAAKLWKLSRDFGIKTERGTEIDIRMSVTFLADLLGAPRETTSRVCKTLMEHGLINMNRKRITITDPERMSYFYKTGIYKESEG